MTVIPSNTDAEEQVLGAMLLGGGIIDRVAAIVPDGKAFWKPANGKLYDAIVRMHYDGRPVDPVTLAHDLEREGETGMPDLAMLVGGITATGNVEHYAHIVVDEYRRRRLLDLATGLTKIIEDGAGGMEALDAFDQALVNARSDFDRGRDSVYTAFQLASQYEQEMKNPTDDEGVATPFTFLPPMMGGRLYVLGGYTADGKTVCAVQYLRHAAINKARVGLVTLEMSAMQLTERVLAAAGVPYRQVIKRRFDLPFQSRIEAAIGRLAEMNIEVIDDPTADAAAISRYQRAGRYDLLIVDHLHRMGWNERRELEQQVVGITNVAKRFNVPVLLIVQLSRSGGGDPFPLPSLRSLRETSVIEQEAARVDFIWRQRDDRHLPTDVAEYVVAKNRFGPVGSHALTFNKQEVRFEE